MSSSYEPWRGKKVIALDPLKSMETFTVKNDGATLFYTVEKGTSEIFEKKDFVLMDEDPGGGAQ